MSSRQRQFRVVTHQTWLYEHLAAAGPAVHDFGFDIDPFTAPWTLWWAPGEWAARAHASGVHLPLMSAQPWWMEMLSHVGREKYCGGRTIVATRAVDLWAPSKPFFAKLAEAKTDAMPARVYESKKAFFETRLAAGVPWEAWVNTSTVIDYVSEARFFIAHRRVTAESAYLHDGITWDADGFTPTGLAEMRQFTEMLLSDRSQLMPPGFVLDVGIDTAGRCSVVEANASWSCSPYNCAADGVIESITAAHDFTGEYPEWAWHVDAVHAGARPLRITAAVGGQHE